VVSYRKPDYFRLEHVQEEFDFVTDEDIENSRRFKFIMYRDQEIPYFKNQRVPLLDKEVSDELFAVIVAHVINCLINCLTSLLVKACIHQIFTRLMIVLRETELRNVLTQRIKMFDQNLPLCLLPDTFSFIILTPGVIHIICRFIFIHELPCCVVGLFVIHAVGLLCTAGVYDLILAFNV
jgi:hypothetical protein